MITTQIKEGYENFNIPMEAFFRVGLYLGTCGTQGVDLARYIDRQTGLPNTIEFLYDRVRLSDTIINSLWEREEEFTSDGIHFDEMLRQTRHLLDSRTPENEKAFRTEVEWEVKELRNELSFAEYILKSLPNPAGKMLA